ncbi:hypothetical protein BWK49_10770 [Mycobacterium intracellulare subsp. chimaera]|nr:hypothetical protein BWK49_10770 [Mycobacterium intracellulare subsp. chimaera]
MSSVVKSWIFGLGHLYQFDSAFAFLAVHPRELVAKKMFADLFPIRRARPRVPGRGAVQCDHRAGP